MVTGNPKHNEKADLIIFSDAIFPGVGDKLQSGAVALNGNRIMAVGPSADIGKLATHTTKIYQFKDKLLLPGFHDNHVHIFCGSLSEQSPNLHHAKSEEEAAAAVASFAESHPDDEWIFGFGWYHVFWEDNKLPSRESLDRLIPDRPVFLFNAELHGAWVNSKAMDLCNITSDTPNPHFGEIARDESGEPTGFLYENAMGLVAKKAFRFNHKRLKELFSLFLRKTACNGITSVSDMLPLPGMELGDPIIYKKFEQKNVLTTRVHLTGSLSDDLEKAKKLRQNYNSEKLRFSGLKAFLDGVATTYTALFVEPYADMKSTKGITLIPIETARKWVLNADKNGYRIRLHACGDGAVKLGLDFFGEAIKVNGIRDSRHSIEHIENIHPDDLTRFNELGVVASVQPEHLAITNSYSNNPYRKRLGIERESYSWPNKSILKTGANLALGSDYPVVDINPMLEIYRAITRIHNDGTPEGGWTPREKLSLFEVLRAYTYGSAYAAFMENELGIIEPGKLADLVVLDRNIFNTPIKQILECKPILTIMDGKVVFEA